MRIFVRVSQSTGAGNQNWKALSRQNYELEPREPRKPLEAREPLKAKPKGQAFAMREPLVSLLTTGAARSFAKDLTDTFAGSVVRRKNVYAQSLTPKMRRTIDQLV